MFSFHLNCKEATAEGGHRTQPFLATYRILNQVPFAMSHELPSTQPPVKTLKQYQLLKLIGRGPSSAIYQARDESLNRLVALKLLNPESAADAAAAWRFFSQAAAAARIIHPNIVQIFYVGQDGPHCFCAREFVDGTSLEGRLARGDRFAESEAISITIQVLHALAAAHAKGMIHGNLTADNVLLEQKTSRVLLSDFQSAAELNSSNSATGAVPSGQLNVQIDLQSVGSLLKQMSQSSHLKEREHVAAPVSDRAVEIQDATWTKPTRTFITRFTEPGESQPFGSAHDVLIAMRSFVGNVLDERKPIAETSPSPSGPEPTKSPPNYRTAIIDFPSLDAEVELPKGVFEAKPAGFWQRCWNWFSQSAIPAVDDVNQFQDTHAAVDRALSELQRRLRWLDRLAAEGRAVLRDLQGQVVATTDLSESKASQEAQQSQLDDIERRRTELDATIRRLLDERDVLDARLERAKLAGAQTGVTIPVKRKSKAALWGQICLVVGLFSVAGYLLYSTVDWKSLKKSLAGSTPDNSFGVQTPKAKGSGKAARIPFSKYPKLPDHSWIPTAMTAVPLRTLQGHTKPLEYVRTIEFCPGRLQVAGTSMDGTVRFWDVETGLEHRRHVHRHRGIVAGVLGGQFSPNGESLLVWGAGPGDGPYLIDLATSRITLKLDGELSHGKLGLGPLSFAPDGRNLIVLAQATDVPNDQSAQKRFLDYFDPQTGQRTERIPTEVESKWGTWSSAATFLALVDKDGAVNLWDLNQRKVVQRLTGPKKSLTTLRFSADGRQVAGGGSDGEIYVWAVGKNEQASVLPPPAANPEPISDVGFSPDGRVVAGIGGGFATLWDHERQKPIRYLVTNHNQLAFSSDGRFLVTAGYDEDQLGWITDNGGEHIEMPGYPSSMPMVWDASDLDNLLVKSRQPAPESLADSKLTAREKATRELRHLIVTRQVASDAFQECVKIVAPSLPKATVDVGQAPVKWQEITLNKSRTGIDGIRFKSSLSEPADLRWCFAVPEAKRDWLIASPEGKMEQFGQHKVRRNLAFPELPIEGKNQFFFQALNGGHILPGKEYLIVFTFNTQEPVILRFAAHLKAALPLAPPSLGKTPVTPQAQPGDDIAQAMGWQIPLAESSSPINFDWEVSLIDDYKPFSFGPRLPFSDDPYQPALIRHYQLYER